MIQTSMMNRIKMAVKVVRSGAFFQFIVYQVYIYIYIYIYIVGVRVTLVVDQHCVSINSMLKQLVYLLRSVSVVTFSITILPSLGSSL